MFHIHNAVGPKHPNKTNTLRQALQSYWWPDAEEWVTKYVDNCEQCHGELPTIRTTSPTTIPLRSKILEGQEAHHMTLEKWRPLVTLLRALRPDVGRWVTLSPKYWAGRPSDIDGGRAPYAAVLSCDPSWSSKLACCLTRQRKRICTKAETSQRRVSK